MVEHTGEAERLRRVSPDFLSFGLPFATQDVILLSRAIARDGNVDGRLPSTRRETNANNQIGRNARKGKKTPVRKTRRQLLELAQDVDGHQCRAQRFQSKRNVRGWVRASAVPFKKKLIENRLSNGTFFRAASILQDLQERLVRLR